MLGPMGAARKVKIARFCALQEWPFAAA